MFPAPAVAQTETQVGAAIQSYRTTRDARTLIRTIGDELDAGSVPASERARAHVYMATAFLSLGDTLSATPHIEAAIAIHPCLEPSREAAGEWLPLYERSRPPGTSCGSRMTSVTLRSLVIPGWGQRALGRTSASNYFLGSTLVSLAGAAILQTVAGSRYDEYQMSADTSRVASLYDQAEGFRRGALALGITASGIYIWNVIDAVRAGGAHDRRLEEGRSVAMYPTITPAASGTRVGLSILLK
jgi:hypothetical protein